MEISRYLGQRLALQAYIAGDNYTGKQTREASHLIQCLCLDLPHS